METVNNKEEYFHLLMGTKIPSFIYKEDAQKVQKQGLALSKQLNKSIPGLLYRYRSFDSNGYSISALKNDEIWGSTANTFNDPLDTQMFFSPEKVKEEYLKSWKQSNAIRENSNENYQLVGVEDIDSFLTKAANKSDNDEWMLNTIKKCFDELYLNLKTQTFIACFSEHFDSTLMWAHYADSHKGFVLEYSAMDLYPNLCPVRYSSDKINANPIVKYFLSMKLSERNHLHITLEDVLLPVKILTNKTVEWEYENEWRLFMQYPPVLDFNNLYEGGHKILKHAVPKAIYIGINTEEGNEKILKEIAKEKQIQLYKMRLDTSIESDKWMRKERVL